MWTQFFDMCSGGGQKEDWSHIYIEAPEDEAVVIFYNRFGHSPHRVTCTCCGEDYSIHEYETLAEASAYERNCKWDKKLKKYVEEADKSRYSSLKHIPLEDYIKGDGVLVIYAEDIKPEEREGEVPQQGYVWV